MMGEASFSELDSPLWERLEEIMGVGGQWIVWGAIHHSQWGKGSGEEAVKGLVLVICDFACGWLGSFEVSFLVSQ